MFSENENDVSMYGDSDDSNVYSIQRGCSMQRLYVVCCQFHLSWRQLSPLYLGPHLSSRFVCIVLNAGD